MGNAIAKGVIQPSRVAKHSGDREAAIQWLRNNYAFIPEQLRPRQSELDEFAAFFSTYLTSSFDVVARPGTMGERPTLLGCRCELCVRIMNARHLRTKKLYTRDKRRADILMSECVVKLANENRLSMDDDQADQLVADKAIRRSAAYVTYGHWLIQRLAGESDGRAILALWRIIAWDPRGGMRRDFTLELDDFEVAECELLSAIRRAGDA